jgi:4-hydroxy-2-oxoheptanedioate aldolase
MDKMAAPLSRSIAMMSIKDRIHKTKDVLGGYLCVIPSAVVTQALAAAGADWLVIHAGAEGIMFPLVRSAAEAAECVALTHYPPRGRRGWGPFIAHSRWGVELHDYLPQRGPETVCGLLIETKDAVNNIEDICGVEGIDYFMVATFDLSTEFGVPGKFDAPSISSMR